MKMYTSAEGTSIQFHYLQVQQQVISNTYEFTKQEYHCQFKRNNLKNYDEVIRIPKVMKNITSGFFHYPK